MTMNCNLQRLDGPVRGNSKIVQEFEGRFTGSGWNVIKVLWGSGWDDLFASDPSGALVARLESLVDGDEQRIMTADGATIRKDLFNTPELAALVKDYTDEDLEHLCRRCWWSRLRQVTRSILTSSCPQGTAYRSHHPHHQRIRAWSSIRWSKHYSPKEES